mgnify:CR=1 FL=1
MTRSERQRGMGQIDPYQNENPPYIVLMHAARDHAVNLHGRRLNIPAARSKENEGDRPPYGIGLCPIL